MNEETAESSDLQDTKEPIIQIIDMHKWFGEFHVLRGELFMAVDQLKMALASPRIHDYQIARAEARMNQIREYLPKNRRPRPSEQARPRLSSR